MKKKTILLIFVICYFICPFYTVKAEEEIKTCIIKLSDVKKGEKYYYNDLIKTYCGISNNTGNAILAQANQKTDGIKEDLLNIEIMNPVFLANPGTYTIAYPVASDETKSIIITIIGQSSSETEEKQSTHCYCLGEKCQKNEQGNHLGLGWEQSDETRCTTSGTGSTTGGNNSTGGNSGTGQDAGAVEACYKVTEQNDNYVWTTKNALLGQGYSQVTIDTSKTTKESCSKDNKPDGSSETPSGSTTDPTTSSSTTVTSSGLNACNNFRVERVRGYNYCGSKSCSKISHTKDTYFDNLVGLTGNRNYYFVYKTYYNCEGVDAETPITSFCVDPALEGPKVASDGGNNYKGTTESLDINNKFHKGLYYLYTEWFMNRRKDITDVYKGPNDSEDFLDFIMDNIARKLRMTYEPADFLQKKYYSTSWSKNEFNAYHDNELGISGQSEVKKLIKQIWDDVKEFVENGTIDTTTTYSDEWIMPIKKYKKITGDVRSGAETGYYCNYTAGDGEFSKEAFERNEADATAKGKTTYIRGSETDRKELKQHNGIDFSIDDSDIGKVEVYAAQAGTVLVTSKEQAGAGMGNYVVIAVETSDGKKLKTRYLHLDSISENVKKGATVKQGQVLGYVGNTGDSSGAHLHFDVSSYETGTSLTALGKTFYSPRDYLPLAQNNIDICSQEAKEFEKPTESEGTIVKAKGTTVEFEKNVLVSPTLINNNQGFTAEIEFTVNSDNNTVLQNIITGNNKIIAYTNKNDYFDVTATAEGEGWENNASGGYSIKYKIECDNVSALVTNKDFDRVEVGLQISYQDPYSISNILILDTGETNNNQKALQDFVTFLNGEVVKKNVVSIDFEKEKENVCTPMYAMGCAIPSLSTFYLIEGTQSSSVFTAVMAGIKTAGDLQKMLSTAVEVLDKFKDFNFEEFTKTEIIEVLGLLKNFVENGSLVNSIKDEVSDYLLTLANEGNSAAELLVGALNSITYDKKNPTVNTKQLAGVFLTVLAQCSKKNIPTIISEWEAIIKYLQEGVNAGTVSKATLNLFNNVLNFIKSETKDNNLSAIVDAAQKLGNWFFTSADFSTVSDIDSAITATLAALQTMLNDATQYVTNYINKLKTTISKMDITKALTDPSNYDIYNLVKNAIKVDWKKCIVGEDGVEATDPNGNSYTIQQSNDDGYGMFCSIVCKEDYAVKMPGNLGTVYAGRYISTNVDNVYHATVGMAGQRTCVTTDINNEKYKTKALEQKDKMLEAYNDFYKNYSAYLKLKTQENTTTTGTATSGTKPVATYNLVDEATTKLEGLPDKVFEAFKKSVIDFVEKNFSAEVSTRVKTNLAAGTNKVIKKLMWNIVGSAISGNLSASSLQKCFESIIKDAGGKIANLGDNLLKDYINILGEDLKAAINDQLGSSVSDFFTNLGGDSLAVLCNFGTNGVVRFFSDLFGGIGEGIKGACDLTAGLSSTVVNTIEGINTASGNKVFQVQGDITANGYYSVYGYDSNATDAVAKLKSDIYDTGTKATYNLSFKNNSVSIPVIRKNGLGKYEGGAFTYGSVVLEFSNQIGDLLKDIKLTKDEITNITNSFTELFNQLENLGNLSDGASLKAIKPSNFDGLVTLMNKVLGLLSDLAGTTDNAMTDITNTVDKVILIYYDFFGLFNPHYAALASARRAMEEAKSDYYGAQDKLSDMASRMNACTEWSNTYDFNPTIEFTYGYPKTSYLDYIINRKNKTTETVKLKAINKGEAENISYYCDEGVETEHVQDWDVITSGKCRTNDGIFGNILGTLLEDNDSLSKLLSTFKKSKEGIASLKKLLTDTKLQEWVNKSGHADLLNNLLCQGFGQEFCLLFGEDDKDSLVTYIPGNIIYKATINDTPVDSADKFFKILGGIFTGKFDNMLSGITGKFTYGIGKGTSVNYKDVAKVVNITRYGNPGVSISGLNLQNFINMFADYASEKFNNDAAEKIKKAALSWNGQGAQEFIYYKSSTDYWTSSNKGIYTSKKDAEDSVLVDTGDPGLTDPNIKSGTSNDKTPDGLVYPIALTTKEGKYQYQITINSVGQYYNNTTASGRIIGDTGYVSGLFANQYVCSYDVKTEPDTPTKTCQEIYDSAECKDGDNYFQNLYKDNYTNTNKVEYESKWNACINKLLAEDSSCCNLIDANYVPNASQEKYNNMCSGNNKNHCQGIKLYGEDSAIQTNINTTNSSALISNNGTLQFYTKVVSNYDLFPNGDKSKGYNWSGKTSGYENKSDDGTPGKQDLSNIIEQIEDVGDGVYADDEKYLEYSITLNSACMNAIKTYNKNQELIDLGFGDYSASSISKESREYKSQFLIDIQSNSEYSSCKIDSYLK